MSLVLALVGEAQGAAGDLDSSFSEDGRQTTDFGGKDDRGKAVAVQADGKMLVAGFSGFDFALARYNADGTIDNSFGSGGTVTTDVDNGVDAGGAMALQGDGRIVVAGSSHGDFALARYHISGSLDSSFSGDGKQTTRLGGGARALGFRPARSSSPATLPQGVSRGADFAVARYNADGTTARFRATAARRPTSPRAMTMAMRWRCRATAGSW